ncbi:MAG: hypothetical protein ABIN94_18110 [Ferruginibacter sp.]
MKLKNLHTTFLVLSIAVCNLASAQLFIDNAQFTIQPGATVTVQGDVTSNTDILGTGVLQMNGAAAQNLNMNGFSIPNLEIKNPTTVILTGACKVSTSLLFTSGKIQSGAFNFTLADVATISGQGTGKFVETNGAGQVIKLLTANVTTLEIPVGSGTTYRPAFLTTSGTYASASVGVRVAGTPDPNRPPMISDYLASHWPITKTGVTGTVTVAGQYLDAEITGAEATLKGYYFNGTDWSSASEAHDFAANTVSVPITGASGEVFGMDKFILAKAKAFLQGAYNSVTGVMNDNLRTPVNLIPLSDPYRTAPYNVTFVHVANAATETANASVFANQPLTDNNIVDWVFLELRSSTVSPGNTVLQTRSALLKKDGSIVDVDGVSPVTFNNIANGSYTVAVRHRNHLGLSANPATSLLALAEQKSTTPLLDLTTAGAAQLFGAANINYASIGGKNFLYAGNVSGNGVVRYQGTNGPGAANVSDRIALLTDLGNNELNTLNTYQRGDVTMNGITRYQGTNGPGVFNVSDRVFILGTVLSNTELATKIQSLPN